jgi:PAS domain S-box-containing protein
MQEKQKILELRKQAEEILKQQEHNRSENALNEDIARLLEELSIHQIELEMQNDELQRSQQALENEKNKYIDLYENAPVAYLTIAPTGNIISENQQARNLFGASSYEHHYKSIFPYIDQNSKSDFRKLLKNVFVTQTGQSGEISLLISGKGRALTKMHLTPYSDKERNQLLCRITITDIEKIRQQFDDRIKQSEDQYIELAENINEGIYHTENGFIMSVNTPATKMFGYERDEMIGKKVWEFVLPENRNHLREIFLQKIAEQDGTPVEIQCVRKDASIFWAEISMRIVKSQSLVFGVISDITNRKQAETELRRSKERLSMALKGTKAVLWDWDIPSGRVLFDETWPELLGYKIGDIEPAMNSWENLIHEDDIYEAKSALINHLKGRSEFFKHVYRMKTSNGNWKHIMSSGMVTERSTNGRALRVVGTHQDVTRQKLTEEKLRELNVTKDKLFSIIAHDLKSPYNAQLGFLELLLEDGNNYTPDQRKKFLNTVYNSTKQSFALLDNLLVWSRNQTGKIPFNPEVQLVAQLFEEAIDLQKYAAEAKKISIDIELSDDNLEVSADGEMVNTILRNLLSNAIKFTHNHGKIILGSRIANNSQLLIYVKDNGIGINDDDQKMLFDPLSFHTTVGTNREKGTGIGLLLCKEFVERNGGKIWVESKINKGSAFYFTLTSHQISRKCDSVCLQNFGELQQKIINEPELYNYIIEFLIPLFRQTYKKFSKEEINCFLAEIATLSKKYNLPEFDTFAKMIDKSLSIQDKNQINICFAEFEKLTDVLEMKSMS